MYSRKNKELYCSKTEKKVSVVPTCDMSLNLCFLFHAIKIASIYALFLNMFRDPVTPGAPSLSLSEV